MKGLKLVKKDDEKEITKLPWSGAPVPKSKAWWDEFYKRADVKEAQEKARIELNQSERRKAQ